MSECKCFNTSHEHHKDRACTDTAEQNGYCRRCNDARKKDFGEPISGHVELRQEGSKTSPGELANLLINKMAKS